MDFPTFYEVKFVSIEKMEADFSIEGIFSRPVVINLSSSSLEMVHQVIDTLLKIAEFEGKAVGVPYPVYLVTPHINKKHLKWPFVVADYSLLPSYYRRQIYLKNSSQIDQLKKFDVFQFGIQEQETHEVQEHLKKMMPVFKRLKEERLLNIKLKNILKRVEQKKRKIKREPGEAHE